MKSSELPKLARAYALKNALSHEGKSQTGSVISSLFHEGLKKSEAGKYAGEISKIVNEVNSMSLEEQEKEFEKLEDLISERRGREELPELPNAKKGKVIMRFAPSASGPFHVGHAMTSSISYLFVKKYGGKFYVRIEDTNPENIYPKAYKMIENDSDWLFEKNAEIMIQSYRMEIYYKYVEKLLKKNAVYVCTCTQESFEKYVNEKKECPCRNISLKENTNRWLRMLDKSSKGFRQGGAVVRFKSFKGMKDPNPAMRDFPLARINVKKHPLQKNKYRVWPLMNLAVSVDDIETKATHIIRGKDHIDNAKRQGMIFNVLGEKFPWTGFLGRFKFKDMELSTTKMRKDIESGKYKGWDDKNLPTLVSLRKQGYNPQAFWNFAEKIGLSENDKVMDRKEFFAILKSFNK